jgi:hypothetical protein
LNCDAASSSVTEDGPKLAQIRVLTRPLAELVAPPAVRDHAEASATTITDLMFADWWRSPQHACSPLIARTVHATSVVDTEAARAADAKEADRKCVMTALSEQRVARISEA